MVEVAVEAYPTIDVGPNGPSSFSTAQPGAGANQPSTGQLPKAEERRRKREALRQQTLAKAEEEGSRRGDKTWARLLGTGLKEWPVTVVRYNRNNVADWSAGATLISATRAPRSNETTLWVLSDGALAGCRVIEAKGNVVPHVAAQGAQNHRVQVRPQGSAPEDKVIILRGVFAPPSRPAFNAPGLRKAGGTPAAASNGGTAAAKPTVSTAVRGLGPDPTGGGANATRLGREGKRERAAVAAVLDAAAGKRPAQSIHVEAKVSQGKQDNFMGELVKFAFSPQGGVAMKALEAAFPGARYALGTAAAGVFQALASGAHDIFSRTTRVDAYYRTCYSWAEGKHYMDGGVNEAHPTWGLSRRNAMFRASEPTGVAATWCDHTPESCVCLGRDVSEKTLVFGMSGEVTTAQVARWVRRWGRVFAIVPNPQFNAFETRVVRGMRVFMVPGEAAGLALPSTGWFGYHSHSPIPRWFWETAEDLTWVRVPLGAAFTAVEFNVRPRAVAPATYGGAGSAASAVWGDHRHVSELPLIVDVEGRGQCRASVVTEVVSALAGRPLEVPDFAVAERTAARAVAARPGEIEASEEIQTAAEVGWARVRAERHRWAPAGFVSELATALEPGAWGFVHGSLRRSFGRIRIFAMLALVLALRRLALRWLRAGAQYLTGAASAAVVAVSPEEKSRMLAAAMNPPMEPVGILGVYRKLFTAVWNGAKLDPNRAFLTLTAPFYEEYLKHHWPWTTYAIAYFEFVRDLLVAGSSTQPDMQALQFISRIGTCAHHFAWASMPLPQAIAAHFVNNLVAIATAGGGLALSENYAGPHAVQSVGVEATLVSTSWFTAATRWAQGQGPPQLPGVCALEADGDCRTPSSPAIALTAVPQPLPTCEDRILLRLVGPGVAIAPPVVYRSCVHNELAAMDVRLGGDVLWFREGSEEPWRDLHEKLRAEYREWYWAPLTRVVGPLGVEPTPFLAWLRHYPGSMRRVLENAREEARAKGLKGRHRRIKAFVKMEGLPKLLSEVAQKDPKPRLIQGRDPIVTASAGPWMHAMGKALRNAWPIDGLQPIAYISGADAEQVGEWYQASIEAGLEPVPLDVEVFDASVGPGPHRSWARDVRDLRPNPPVRALMDERERGHLDGNPGVTRFGVKYLLRWEVRSGDLDTSVGNSSNHGKIWVPILSKRPGERVALSGDNALWMARLGVTQPEVDAVVKTYETYGFRVKIESEGRGPHQGQICSGRLWALAGGKWIYGPKIGRIMSKTFWMLHPSTKEPARLRWLRGVALGLLRDTAFIPVLRVAISRLVRETSSMSALPAAFDPYEPWRTHATAWHEIDDATWAQAAELYACSVEQLKDLETWVANLPTLIEARLQHPLLDRIVTIDLS